MYPAWIPHVSRMYPASQIRTSQDTFEIHVSHDVSWKYSACIPHVSSNHCRCMYPACILHVSSLYPTCILHVSRVRSSSQVCLPCNSYRGAVQRALSAQVGSDECIEEEGGAHGELSKGTGASPSARAPSGARLQRRRGGAPSAPWAAGQIEQARDTYPECICGVSREYLVCIQRGSDEASKIHVS